MRSGSTLPKGRRPKRRVPQDPDRARTPRLPAVLPGSGPRHRLSGPDHHRGERLPHRHRAPAAPSGPLSETGWPWRKWSRRCFRVRRARRLKVEGERDEGGRDMTLRIGNAPCSWGVRIRRAIAQSGLGSGARRVCAAGYSSIESGPWATCRKTPRNWASTRKSMDMNAHPGQAWCTSRFTTRRMEDLLRRQRALAGRSVAHSAAASRADSSRSSRAAALARTRQDEAEQMQPDDGAPFVTGSWMSHADRSGRARG